MGVRARVLVTMLMVSAVGALLPARAAVILDSLAVRIYDSAGILTRDRARAVEQARDILGRAGLAVRWLDCPARGARIRSGCTDATSPGELVVRLVRSPRNDANGRVLGTALIDESTGAGTLATVFVDRVVAVAGADPWPTVGRVMAHELGHLLLGTNSHTDSGLMREMWSARDLTRNRPEDWLFSSAQRSHLQSSMLQLRSRARS